MKTINFLTTLIPVAMYDRIGQKTTYNMQYAADDLQRYIHEGICKNLGRDIERKASDFVLLPKNPIAQT